MKRLYTIVALCVLATPAAGAQCRDGSPPPCATVRQAAAPPAANVRGRSFLLLPFRNVTRHAEQEWLETGASLMLAHTLGRFSDLHVVPEERILAARRKLGMPADAVPDATQLRALASETGGWTAISGNIFATGKRLRITVQAMDVLTSRVLVRAEREIAADADPRQAFDDLSVRLLEPTGIPPGTASLAEMTTQSIDAFRAYARGMQLVYVARFREAEEEFLRAVQLDSAFVLAWVAIAATSVNTGGVAIILNPASLAYRAIQQASRFANNLSPRDAQYVRGVYSIFHGQMRRGSRQLDSAFASNPHNMEAAYWIASVQIIGPSVDTTVDPHRLDSSPHRTVSLASMILERDPQRRSAYVLPLTAYGLGAGVLWGDIFGYRREFSSFGAALLTNADVREVPVLRSDTLELMPRSTFDSLPDEERLRLRRRSADVAWEWVERWLMAGPDDAEAHLWAARVSEVRGDYDRALHELRVADSLGIQSSLENMVGWRLSLLVLSGQVHAAAAMADSLLTAGKLTNAAFLRVFDRRRPYGAAALLLDKRWVSAAAMARAMASRSQPDAACTTLRREMVGFADAVLPYSVRRAVMDTVTAHNGDVTADATLSPCADVLGRELHP